MKKLKSIEQLIKLLEYDVENAPFLKYPKFVKVTADDNSSVKEVFKQFTKVENGLAKLCRGDNVYVYNVAGYAIMENDNVVYEYSPAGISDLEYETCMQFLNENALYAPFIQALRLDIFKTKSPFEFCYDEEHYIGTIVFYGA